MVDYVKTEYQKELEAKFIKISNHEDLEELSHDESPYIRTYVALEGGYEYLLNDPDTAVKAAANWAKNKADSERIRKEVEREYKAKKRG
jgi:hypothetical protein